ncbi:MAG: hypothetical protein V4640_08805 [Verrucomicrobiota bacterium]
MNLRFSTAFAAMGCILLASCYPYNENRGRKETGKPPEKSVSSPDQQKIQAQRDKLKQDELKKKETETLPSETVGNGSGEATTTDPGASTTPDTTPKPTAEKKRDYAFASKVPGKEGFVFSPYNNKIIDVRDMPSGTLVSDPTYPESEKKYFRVP